MMVYPSAVGTVDDFDIRAAYNEGVSMETFQRDNTKAAITLNMLLDMILGNSR